MLAVAVAVPTVRFSKLPPLTPVMLALRLLASRYTSSPLLTGITRVPLKAPLLIVMTPWSVVTVVTPCEALLKVAVKV